MRCVWLALIGLIGTPAAAGIDTLDLAVASNFRATAEELSRQFQRETGSRVRISSGATGKLYAQIRSGAPFDILLAGDSARPRKLEAQGMIRPGSRFTYAIGHLALWSPDPRRIDQQGEVLRRANIHRLAIANPNTAPYGAAARTALMRLGLWQRYRGRLVRGENVGQAFQFTVSGGVDAGFVAVSQIRLLTEHRRGSWWLVPQRLYSPLEQQAVLLRQSDSADASRFVRFLRSPAARQIIEKAGYGLP